MTVLNVTSVVSGPAIAFDDSYQWNYGFDSQSNVYALASKSMNAYDIHDKNHCKNDVLNPSSAADASVNWNGVMRLLFLSLVSTGGSMGSIFIISAITVIDTFQTRGNVYLVSLALGHLMVTIFVLPASCVAIMAGIPNDPSICHFQWILTIACLMISVLSFMLMAVENFLGLGSLVAYDICCTKLRILAFVFLTWLWGIGFASAQHVYNFGPSFCAHERSNPIWLPYHASVAGCALYETNPSEDPWAYVFTDESLSHSNAVVYLISLLMWAPFCVVSGISTVKPVSNDVLQTVWWIAISNSCSYSFVYAFTNKDFGDAFFKLFYYCCCKSHVTFTRKGAGIRRAVANDPMGLRVHIIPGLNIYNQRRDPPMATVPSRAVGGGGFGAMG
ncbi:histamine H2 receptor-like protein, partial [Leptotrombidium deliense]